MRVRFECNRPQPAINPQRGHHHAPPFRQCNRPQPAINPQRHLNNVAVLLSVIDPSLRSIRNGIGFSSSSARSVIDPSLRSIRNAVRLRQNQAYSVIDPSLRSIRNAIC